MAGFFQEADETDDARIRLLGDYQVRFGAMKPVQPGKPPAGGLILALQAPDEYIIAGRNLWSEFMTPGAVRQNVECLSVEQGRFHNGVWISERRLNGDETGHNATIMLGEALTVQRVKRNRRSAPVFNNPYSM
jgi:hypothetical protein